ncbi:MAG TPA: DUF1772 domain-containing protein [Thermoanaerobaculia bacterium]
MNHTIESALRFVNVTTSGLLAGSLGFGGSALVPGWKEELPERMRRRDITDYFDAIGPVALGTAVALAIAARGEGAFRRALDAGAAIGLAGVLASTLMVTVPISREMDAQPATDYPSEKSKTLVTNWGRAHVVRRTLGIGAFLCAAAAAMASQRK